MLRIFLFDQRLLKEPHDLCFGDAEAERIAAIKNPKRRLESIAALVALNELIKISFEDTGFEILRATSGKPYFKDRDVSFSLSHSGDISVAALCDEKDNIIGIDIERIANRSNIEELSERFFNSAEKQEFIESDKSIKAFFDIWTKKEAYAKMTGEGLVSVLGEQALVQSQAADTMCYEFYNNTDVYSLSIACLRSIKNVEFYNNSANIKMKNQ